VVGYTHTLRAIGVQTVGRKLVGRKTFGRIIFWATDDWATTVNSHFKKDVSAKDG